MCLCVRAIVFGQERDGQDAEAVGGDCGVRYGWEFETSTVPLAYVHEDKTKEDSLRNHSSVFCQRKAWRRKLESTMVGSIRDLLI